MFRKHYRHHKKLSKSIASNIEYLKEQFGNSSDLSVRNIFLSNHGKAAIIHIQGIVDEQSLHDSILFLHGVMNKNLFKIGPGK